MPVYPGVVSGTVFLHKGLDLDALCSEKLEIESVDKELSRLDNAVERSLRQIKGIEKKLGGNIEGQLKGIFKAQAQMLKDKGFLDNIRNTIIKQKSNIEYVISYEINKLEEKFKSMEDETFKSRFMDVQDTYKRLLRNVLDLEHLMRNPFKRLKKPVVIVSADLYPSDIAALDTSQILGFAIEEGNLVSHAAIIARTIGVPAVIRVSGVSEQAGMDDRILIDGFKGEVLLNPSDEEVRKRRKRGLEERKNIALNTKSRQCRAKNGEKIILEANISTIEEANLAKKNGAEGVGLLRTEFFYMVRNSIPDIEEEINFYKEMIDIFRGFPVVFRLLDIGSDKTVVGMPIRRESNPQMGIRGIRYLLEYPEIMKRQLWCLMRAAQDAEDLRILLPFITVKDDITRAKEIIRKSASENDFDADKLKIGIMAEVPSVALDMDSYIENVDFISIGTNDLLQYIFAVSREDAGLDSYRNSSHPLLLRIIKDMIKTAFQAGKTVNICGEVAGDPDMALILVRIGARHLSMQPQSLPYVRKKLSGHH